MKRLVKIILALVMQLAAVQFACAVDVNSADAASLDSVKDIGPKTAAKIIEERNKNGPFKDWDDLVNRVKGIGPKNSDAMSASGLTVNGRGKPNAPMAKSAHPKEEESAAMAPGKSAGSASAAGAGATKEAAQSEPKETKRHRSKKEAAEKKAEGKVAAAEENEAKASHKKHRSKKDKDKSKEAEHEAAKGAKAEAEKGGAAK
jgi:competence protein ComEA